MDKILRIDEVAEVLAVSKAYVYLLLARGQLPCLRMGKARRVLLTDLEKFISTNMFSGETNIPNQKESAL